MTWKIKPEVTVGNILMMLSIAGGFVVYALGLESRMAVSSKDTDLRIKSIEKQIEVRAATQDKIIDQLADDLRYLARMGGKKD